MIISEEPEYVTETIINNAFLSGESISHAGIRLDNPLCLDK